MPQYQIRKSKHPLLKPYIEDYMYVSGELPFTSKKLPPRPGASLLLDFDSPFYCNDDRFVAILSGIQKESLDYRPDSKRNDHLVVRFQPHGLSRFTDIPVSELTDRIVEPETVFGHEIYLLYQQAGTQTTLDQRIALVEQFLVDRFSLPSAGEEAIFEIARTLREDPGEVDFDSIREQTPMSTRQIERKFKAMVGLTMQTYLRICRFDYAKSLVLRSPSLSLTDISFDVGYYDQPHFVREVKRMTGVSPKELEACMAD